MPPRIGANGLVDAGFTMQVEGYLPHSQLPSLLSISHQLAETYSL